MQMFPWPPLTPDLSPIEYVWTQLTCLAAGQKTDCDKSLSGNGKLSLRKSSVLSLNVYLDIYWCVFPFVDVLLSTFVLSVTRIPYKPPASPSDIVIKEVERTEATVMWKTPYAGNSPITRYVVQYWRDTGSTPKLEEENVGSEKTSHQLRNLRPGTSYVVRVIADNEFGSSTPSVPIRFYTAEDRAVWLGSTRTRPPRCLPPLLLDSILPLQILTSSFHHFTETVQGLIKSLTFIIEMTLKRRYFNISRQLILFLRDFMKFLISSFSCDIH
ncbi:UNVERIFIED_CONTAM: Receptor-type tyrosine-protein phosphatase F [Trichonephila clavipes]